MNPRALVLAALLLGSARAMAGDIFGEWWTPGFNARVLIYQCGQKACGNITWTWEETPPGIAEKKPLTGQAIFTGLAREEGGKWEGRIYNPEDGRSYSSNVGLLTTETLEINGCVLMFCRRQVWRRFDAARCPPVAPIPREPEALGRSTN